MPAQLDIPTKTTYTNTVIGHHLVLFFPSSCFFFSITFLKAFRAKRSDRLISDTFFRCFISFTTYCLNGLQLGIRNVLNVFYTGLQRNRLFLLNLLK